MSQLLSFNITDDHGRTFSSSMDRPELVDKSLVQYIAALWYQKYEVTGVVGSNLLIQVDDKLYKAVAGATSTYQIVHVGNYMPVYITVPSTGYTQVFPRTLVGTTTQGLMSTLVHLAGWLSCEAWQATSDDHQKDTLPEMFKVAIGSVGNPDYRNLEIRIVENTESKSPDRYQFVEVGGAVKMMEVYELIVTTTKKKLNDELD